MNLTGLNLSNYAEPSGDGWSTSGHSIRLLRRHKSNSCNALGRLRECALSVSISVPA